MIKLMGAVLLAAGFGGIGLGAVGRLDGWTAGFGICGNCRLGLKPSSGNCVGV